MINCSPLMIEAPLPHKLIFAQKLSSVHNVALWA